jgi:hypothetical protein
VTDRTLTGDAYKVVAVGWSTAFFSLVGRALRSRFDVLTAHTAAEADRLLALQPVSVIVCEDQLVDGPGVAFLVQQSQRHPTIQRVLVVSETLRDSAAVLVVGRSPVFLDFTREALDSPLFQVTTLVDPLEARVVLETEPFAVCVWEEDLEDRADPVTWWGDLARGVQLVLVTETGGPGEGGRRVDHTATTGHRCVAVGAGVEVLRSTVDLAGMEFDIRNTQEMLVTGINQARLFRCLEMPLEAEELYEVVDLAAVECDILQTMDLIETENARLKEELGQWGARTDRLIQAMSKVVGHGVRAMLTLFLVGGVLLVGLTILGAAGFLLVYLVKSMLGINLLENLHLEDLIRQLL